MLWQLSTVLWSFTLVSVCQVTRNEALSLGTESSLQEITTAESIAKKNMEGITPAHVCYPFTVADFERREFHNPGYPGETYTNNSDCVLILEAPPGHLVKLDFRDWFAIEPSPNCKNDYLEIRDGAHGFNNIIQHPFCGFEFPQPLTSTDRHLWIHFKSDESIEYKGFKAVFEFIPRSMFPSIATPEMIPCYINMVGLEEGFLNKSNISPDILTFNMKNHMPIDCVWSITVRDERRIQLQFTKFLLEKPNECDSNFIQVFSNHTDMSNLDKTFCGSIAETVLSKGNLMYVRFFNDPRGYKSIFEAMFTEFRDVERGGSNQNCFKDEFDCEDATCISKALRCNGRFNCRHRWDEGECSMVQSLSLSEDHIVIIMIIFGLIVSGMCFTFVFNCLRKLIRDHRAIEEYIRQSREQELNEIDEYQNNMEQYSDHSECNDSGDVCRSIKYSPHMIGAGRLQSLGNNGIPFKHPCYISDGKILASTALRIGGSLSQDVKHSTVDDDKAEAPDMAQNNTNDAESDRRTHPEMRSVCDMEVRCQAPDTCESACQTRESLFLMDGGQNVVVSAATATDAYYAHKQFSTFGYNNNTPKLKPELAINREELKIFINSADGRHDGAPSSYRTDGSRATGAVNATPDVIVTH